MKRFPELDDAVQDLSEVLDRRLVVFDESMNVVAYSIHETPPDRSRLSHILTHSRTWPSLQTGKEPHRIEEFPEIGALFFIRLVDSYQHIIGHLALPLTDSEKAANTIEGGVSNVAIQGAAHLNDLLETWHQNADHNTARSHQRTVNLVTGDPQQRAAAADALLADRILSTSDRYCAVALGVDPRSATQQDHEKAALAVGRTVQFVNETSTATVVGGTLEDNVGVLVFPRPVVVPRLIRILEQPPLTHVRAGIGSLTALSEVHRSFERARIAWRATYLAPRDHEIVVTWDELGLDGMLARLPLEDFTAEDLPFSTRELLNVIDSPMLLGTLEAYLSAGGDALQTARSLNIHRSTLYYRLDKIRHAISGDLRNGVVRRELHTGLRIAELAKLL